MLALFLLVTLGVYRISGMLTSSRIISTPAVIFMSIKGTSSLSNILHYETFLDLICLRIVDIVSIKSMRRNLVL